MSPRSRVASTSTPETPKVSENQLFLWTYREIVLCVAQGIVLSSMATFLLVLLIFVTIGPIGPLLTVNGIAAVILAVVVVTAIVFCFRNRFVKSFVTRARFSRLFRIRTFVLWVDQIALVLLLITSAWLIVAWLSKLAELLSPDLIRVWIIVFVVSTFSKNLVAYTDFLREDGQTYLCLMQALASSNYSDSLSWLYRGIDGVAKVLEGADIDVSSRRLRFGINAKLLRGKSVSDLVEKIANAILVVSTRKGLGETHSSDLIETLRILISEADETTKFGVGLAPSYHDKIASMWELVSKSGSLLTVVIYIAIVLVIYIKTGQIPQTIIP
ncbi:MAG: hypothetical protein ABSC50_12685 [Candidatus Bathyarchaeia archaeon]